MDGDVVGATPCPHRWRLVEAALGVSGATGLLVCEVCAAEAPVEGSQLDG